MSKKELIKVKKGIYTVALESQMKKWFQENLSGYVENDYYDATWTIKSYYSLEKCKFDFSGIPEEYLNIVKTYLTVMLSKSYAVEYVKSIFRCIDRFFRNYGDDIDIEKIAEVGREYMIFDFVEFSVDERLYEIIKDMNILRTKQSRKSRKIPNYETLIELDYIIEDFSRNATQSEFIFYYPVVLWWEFANIIPMRRTEMILMKKNCLFVEKDQFYVEIPTLKKHNNQREVIYDKMAITKEMHDFIKLYQQATIDEERVYLFSRSIYVVHNVVKSSKERNVFTIEDFRYLLNHFLNEIVVGRYGKALVEKGASDTDGEYVERICLGDLRHVAFYNSMIQGLDPYTIQRLARHTSIYSQEAYYSNLKPYCENKAQVMAMRIKQKALKETSFPDLDAQNPFRARDSLLSTMKRDCEDVEKRDMGSCYCTSRNFPYECPPDTECILCPKHLPKENVTKETASVNEAICMRERKALEEATDLIHKICRLEALNNQIGPERRMLNKRLNNLINRYAMAIANVEDKHE